MTEEELSREFVRFKKGTNGQVDVQVRVISWPQPHTPSVEWVLWRTIDKAEDLDRKLIAQEVVVDERFFGTCKECKKRNPQGWMQGDNLCQGCDRGEHGIVPVH